MCVFAIVDKWFRLCQRPNWMSCGRTLSMLFFRTMFCCCLRFVWWSRELTMYCVAFAYMWMRQRSTRDAAAQHKTVNKKVHIEHKRLARCISLHRHTSERFEATSANRKQTNTMRTIYIMENYICYCYMGPARVSSKRQDSQVSNRSEDTENCEMARKLKTIEIYLQIRFDVVF